jgi:outer membrane immunogenic protein
MTEHRRIFVTKIVALTAFSALAAAAAPAAAQTVAAPVGPRVEALVGYDALRVDLSDFGLDERLKDNDLFYGVGGGFDFAVSPSMSAGVDVELSGSNNETDFAEGEENVEIRTGRDAYVGGRLTLPVSQAANVYLKAGYTNLKIKGEDNGVEDSFSLDGWRAGAGGQFGIGGGAYVGGEYRYSDYEDDVSRHQLAVLLGTRF